MQQPSAKNHWPQVMTLKPLVHTQKQPGNTQQLSAQVPKPVVMMPIANGTYAKASGKGAVAIGKDAQAKGRGSVAQGAGAVAYGDHSVALGSHSVAKEDKVVSIGSRGDERRLTNVAPGLKSTDGANISQLTTMAD